MDKVSEIVQPTPSAPMRRRWRWPLKPWKTVVLALALVFFIAFSWVYVKYALMIEEKLGDGSMRTNSMVYAMPRTLNVGDPATPFDIADHLKRAGYTDANASASFTSKTGSYRVLNNAIEISTGTGSYFEPHTATVQFAGGKVSRVYSHTHKQDSSEYMLEPEIITNLFDRNREKRRLVRYNDLPKHLVNALVSLEDKRFFNHGGLDIFRVAKAAYVDIREGRMEQGASTLTMQIARSFFLDQEKTWKRKLAEAIITMELERRFSKEQILEFYANEIYLGRSGSFSVHGFGEGARAYFGKEVGEINLPEAAMLVGIIQRPSYYNPFKAPDRVKQRRDLCLTMMHQNDYITAEQLAVATQEPIRLKPAETESSDAPYFVDLVNEDLQQRFQDWDFASNSFRVYSTLDMNLQRAAVEAVETGMKEVDKNIRSHFGKKAAKLPQAQVALIALDAHTGAVKALVGGRGYNKTQLNRALAKRQPGSSFKPFVYAAALNETIENKNVGITLASRVLDAPTRWVFNRQVYEPGNFGDRFYGQVTLRQALTKSLNIPTIKIAEKAGYQHVVDLAKAAGITAPLQATPSLALGSYEVTPLEIAQAYTVFSNGGAYVPRHWITSIRDRKNAIVHAHVDEPKQVLDPRVAYIMVNMMEDVIKQGTAASVRSRGFTIPAAGKTGTSRDGWFAGFTSELLTVVWVGFDDYTELELEGSKSALPVWTEFMKRAHQFREYSDASEFKAPEGVVRQTLCAYTGQIVGEVCPYGRTELFVAGTQPRRCNGDHYEYEYMDTGGEVQPREREERRGNVLGRIFGVFR